MTKGDPEKSLFVKNSLERRTKTFIDLTFQVEEVGLSFSDAFDAALEGDNHCGVLFSQKEFQPV